MGFDLAEGLRQFSQNSLIRKVVEKREELWLMRYVENSRILLLAHLPPDVGYTIGFTANK